MGVLFAFLVGWTIGARGGKQGYDDVLAAAKEVLASDEFATLKAATRSHASFTLRQLAEWLQETREPGSGVEDVLARVRRLVQSPAKEADAP